LLDQDDGEWDLSVLGTLGSIGPAAREAVPRVRGTLRASEDSRERLAAALALWRIEPGSLPEVVPLLVDLLARGSAARESNAWVGPAMALRQMGPAASAAVPLLVRIGADAGRPARLLAWNALARIAPEKVAPHAAELVARLREDEFGLSAVTVAEILMEIRDGRADVRAALANAARSENPYLRRIATGAGTPVRW
jgi:hypothetical protein